MENVNDIKLSLTEAIVSTASAMGFKLNKYIGVTNVLVPLDHTMKTLFEDYSLREELKYPKINQTFTTNHNENRTFDISKRTDRMNTTFPVENRKRGRNNETFNVNNSLNRTRPTTKNQTFEVKQNRTFDRNSSIENPNRTYDVEEVTNIDILRPDLYMPFDESDILDEEGLTPEFHSFKYDKNIESPFDDFTFNDISFNMTHDQSISTGQIYTDNTNNTFENSNNKDQTYNMTEIIKPKVGSWKIYVDPNTNIISFNKTEENLSLKRDRNSRSDTFSPIASSSLNVSRT